MLFKKSQLHWKMKKKTVLTTLTKSWNVMAEVVASQAFCRRISIFVCSTSALKSSISSTFPKSSQGISPNPSGSYYSNNKAKEKIRKPGLTLFLSKVDWKWRGNRSTPRRSNLLYSGRVNRRCHFFRLPSDISRKGQQADVIIAIGNTSPIWRHEHLLAAWKCCFALKWIILLPITFKLSKMKNGLPCRRADAISETKNMQMSIQGKINAFQIQKLLLGV